MTRLRQTIARRLKEAQNTAAMLTTFNEVDMTAVMALRNQYKDALREEARREARLHVASSPRPASHALKEVPEVNAEIDGTDLVYKNYVHMGIAVGTQRAWWCRWCATPTSCRFAAIEKKIDELGKRPATASSRWPTCRAAPSPSRTAGSTAR